MSMLQDGIQQSDSGGDLNGPAFRSRPFFFHSMPCSFFFVFTPREAPPGIPGRGLPTPE